MNNSLLSHIASNFIKEYENVANSSIAYLLNKYPASRKALEALIKIENAPTFYETEVSAGKNGRFDIVGKNELGQNLLIIEGKFWAKLTKNQPMGYLKELNDNGKLLFLAPDRRIPSLKAEVSKIISTDDTRIEFHSWNDLLGLIEIENNKNYNPDLVSDLVQLKALCLKMDEEDMPPLSHSDLDPMNGRITYQFADVIDDCNRLIRQWNESDFNGLKSSAFKGGYGFYFRAFGFGCHLQFSSKDWFKRKSHTPFWLNINNINFEKDINIYYHLKNFDSENTYMEYPIYAILIHTGMDKDQLVNSIVEKTRKVLIYLNESMENKSEPTP